MNKMKIFRNIVVLVILFLPSTHAVGQPYEGLSSVLVEEGKLAEISCVTNGGSQSEYFWRKGESLHNSTDIAFFISGLPTDESGRFEVTEIGTLIVKKVTLDDEGKYICRVSSEESDCHGEVFVFVKAVLQDFQLTIENCEPENSCVISTESTKPTSLTCKATNASPSMKLKWFNGSREIKDNIEENSLTKGPSREISSTIRNVYKAPSPLTCQAVDFKTSNDDGMFAHVQFRTPAATTDISPGWIVTAILFIVGFVILFMIVIFITVWRKVRNGKDGETQNSTELESLLKSNNERLEANLQTKDDEITKLITDLKTKDNDIKKKVEEITKLNTELMGTKAEKKLDEYNVTNKDEELQNKRKHILKLEEASQIKDKQIQSKNEEITKLKLEVQGKDYNLKTKDKEITKLKEASQSKDDQIKTRNEEITTLRETVIKADANKEVKDVTLEAKTKEHTREIQLRDQNIANMKINAQRYEQELNKCKQDIASLNAKVQEQDNEIQLKDQRINRMKDLDKKAHEIESQHTNALKKEEEMKNEENKLKKKEEEMKNEENKLKDSYMKLEKSERDFRAMKMAELETITRFCGIVPLKDSRVLSVKMDGKISSITSHDKTFRFSHIFNIGANVRETFERMSDFVENAIDGGQSCVIAIGNSKRYDQMKTMYGEQGIIPLSFKKILERSIELKRITYTVNVKARFVHALWDKGCEFFIFKGIKDLADHCVEPTDVESIDVNDEKTMGQLLKHHLESQQETKTVHDCFVQFTINTTIDNAKVAPRTGKITFATLFGIEMIKKCFSPEPTDSKLAQYLSKIIRDPNSKSLLLVHLNEDRDDVREFLRVTGQITEFSKKKSVLQKLSGK